ncbi:MAG: hypothetical protein QM778_38550 [Myxococcales bacterium]
MLGWSEVRAEFVWDGSWRDLCVRAANLDDWQHVLDALRVAGFSMEYTVAGVPSELPLQVSEVFMRSVEGCLLSVTTAGVLLVTQFFDEDEIVFDLDPREVVGQVELDAALAFMKVLACATGKDALMTPENMHDVPFIRVDAAGNGEYESSGGFFESRVEPS